MYACCCIFPKGEQNFLAAKRPCGQFADSFADSHEKGVTSFDVTPRFLWSQHADLNRGPTDYEQDNVKKLEELHQMIDVGGSFPLKIVY